MLSLDGTEMRNRNGGAIKGIKGERDRDREKKNREQIRNRMGE